jgi:endonuclease/exonuclease/phosphatase family metal-dependent hydrolase
LASYNLLHGICMRSGRLDLEAAADAIAALHADVVALQEVDRDLERSGGVDQVAWLAGRLGLQGLFAPALLGDPGTRWTALHGTDPGGPAYGVGLLSRTPLAAPERLPLPGGGDGFRRPGATPQNPGWDNEPRVTLAATVKVGGTEVRVATAHLSYLPWRGLAQLHAAADRIAARAGPAALLGDLNLPSWPVRLLLGDGWTHAGGAPTYPAWRPRIQVDQLLVRGGLTVRDIVVAAPATSDHLPLVATVAVPPILGS